MQVYWCGPYIGSTVGSVIYHFSEFIKDNFEQHRPQADKNEDLGIYCCFVVVCLSHKGIQYTRSANAVQYFSLLYLQTIDLRVAAVKSTWPLQVRSSRFSSKSPPNFRIKVTTYSQNTV